MKNIKLHFIALCLVVISEYIGIVKFNLGKGVIALFPMLYAMIFGVLTKFLKIVNEKDMCNFTFINGKIWYNNRTFFSKNNFC